MAIAQGLDSHVVCERCGSKDVILRDQAEREAARRILARRGVYNDVWVPIVVLFTFLASICAVILIAATADEIATLLRSWFDMEELINYIALTIACLIPSVVTVLAIAYSRMRSKSPAALQATELYLATRQKARDHYDQYFPFVCKKYGHPFDHTRQDLHVVNVKDMNSYLVLEQVSKSKATSHISVDDVESEWGSGLSPYGAGQLTAQMERDDKRWYEEQKAKDMEWRENFRDRTGRDPTFWEDLIRW